MKMYGPYTRKDDRSHIIWYDEQTQKKTTQSYPRYLMELKLNRKLESWEQVDHINNNCSDNRIENLQILTQLHNIRKSHPGKEYCDFICPHCKVEFQLEMRQYRANQLKRGNAGPYCGRSCAGKVHH